MLFHLLLAFAALWLSPIGALSAHAQVTVAAGPSAAEGALLRSDYLDARRLASESIAAGGHDTAALASAQLALARAEAHLGDGDAARRAFVAVLALSPAFRLGRDEPLELRSPYLEARGFWSAYAAPFTVRARFGADDASLVVEVEDPAQLCARARVRARVLHAERFVEKVQAPGEPVQLMLSGLLQAGAAEYSVSLLDEHGNRLFELGSEQRPELLRTEHAPGPRATLSETPLAASSARAGADPYRVGGGVALGLGGGALLGGVIASIRREALASDWNHVRCSGSGVTRAERCADERHHISTTQRVAGAAYGIGAASVIVGALLLLVDPARREALRTDLRAPSVRCAPGPGLMGLGCTGI